MFHVATVLFSSGHSKVQPQPTLDPQAPIPKPRPMRRTAGTVGTAFHPAQPWVPKNVSPTTASLVCIILTKCLPNTGTKFLGFHHHMIPSKDLNPTNRINPLE